MVPQFDVTAGTERSGKARVCERACIETNAATAFLKEVLAGLDVKRIIGVYNCARSGLAFKAMLLNLSVPQDCNLVARAYTQKCVWELRPILLILTVSMAHHFKVQQSSLGIFLCFV